MSIRFFCPLGHRLKVPDHRAGKKGRCPQCHQRVIVPVSDPRPSGQSKRPWNADQKTAAADRPLRRKRKRGTAGSNKVASRPRGAVRPAGPPAATSEIVAIFPPEERIELRMPPVAADRPPRPPVASLAPSPCIAPAPGIGGFSPAAAAAAAATAHAAGPQITSAHASNLPAPRLVARARPELLGRVAPKAARKVETAWWLAAALACLAVFGAAPALQHLNLAAAPAWARLLLSASGLELVYVLWLVSMPDWSTIRVGIYLWGAAAVMHAVLLAVMAAAPADNALHLRLAASAPAALIYSAANLVLATSACYACGRISSGWRAAEQRPAPQQAGLRPRG